MAKIKLRYSIAYCSNALRFQDDYNRDDEIQFDEFWWCDPYDGCSYYKRPEDAGIIANPRCAYCNFRNGEFEKTVRSYDYYDGYLTVAGRKYTPFEIKYLEIDGRILKGEEAEDEPAYKYGDHYFGRSLW